MKIATSKFLGYGLRLEWLNIFLWNLSDWYSCSNLGSSQVKSWRNWLIESELIDKNNKPTTIAKLFSKTVNHALIWEIIWINLYHNVNLVRWYLDTFDWYITISKDELLEKLGEDDTCSSSSTVRNAVSSLIGLFTHSPIGYKLKIGQIEKIRRKRYVKKTGTNNVHPLIVAYSLYKAAEYLGRKDFTVSELYDKSFGGGPYKLFGVSRCKLEKTLRGLQEGNKLLRVDLVADLDNIYLDDNFSSLDVVSKSYDILLKNKKEED